MNRFMLLWPRGLLSTIAVLIWLLVGFSVRVTAAPASVFVPHLDRIRQNLPPNFVMRLPSQIVLGGPADNEFIQTLSVRIATSDSPSRLTVGLFSCEDDSQFCRVGTFSAALATSLAAQQDYQQHVAAAAPIQLTKTIRGYLLIGSSKHPASAFSSVMWQQDGMIYTISLANPERQNMLYMAVYMANDAPIYANNAALQTMPTRTMPSGR